MRAAVHAGAEDGRRCGVGGLSSESAPAARPIPFFPPARPAGMQMWKVKTRLARWLARVVRVCEAG